LSEGLCLSHTTRVACLCHYVHQRLNVYNVARIWSIACLTKRAA